MKITKTKLKRIIKEEISRVLRESEIERQLGLGHGFSNEELLQKVTQGIKKFSDNKELASDALKVLATRSRKAGQTDPEMVKKFREVSKLIKKQAGIISGVPTIEYVGHDTPHDQTTWVFKVDNKHHIEIGPTGWIDADDVAERIADDLGLNAEDPSTLNAIKSQIEADLDADQDEASSERNSYVDRDTGGHW